MIVFRVRKWETVPSIDILLNGDTLLERFFQHLHKGTNVMARCTMMFLFLMFVVSLSACSGIRYRHERALDSAMRSYHTYLQGPDGVEGLGVAVDLIPMEKKSEFFDVMEKKVKTIQIVDYKVRMVEMNEDKSKAVVKIIRTYVDHNQVLHREELTQTWERKGAGDGNWLFTEGDY